MINIDVRKWLLLPLFFLLGLLAACGNDSTSVTLYNESSEEVHPFDGERPTIFFHFTSAG